MHFWGAALILIGMTTVNPGSAHYTRYRTGNPGDVQRPTQGGLMLMGGGQDVDEAFRFLVERGGGGDVLVLRASGEDGYHDYLMNLAQPDSVETLVFHDREASSDPEVVRSIDQAESIFLAGGDQSKYLKYWKDTPVQAALQRALLRGVPLGGTSAGLAVLGDTIFAAHEGSLTSEEVLADPSDARITLEGPLLDLPVLRHTLTDTHFSQRDRMGRLTGFLARANQDQTEVTRGLAVDEATAVLVEPDGQARVVGRHDAYFVTPAGPAEVLEPGRPLTYRGLAVRKLSPGESLDLNTWSGSQGESSRLDVEAGVLKNSPI